MSEGMTYGDGPYWAPPFCDSGQQCAAYDHGWNLSTNRSFPSHHNWGYHLDQRGLTI